MPIAMVNIFLPSVPISYRITAKGHSAMDISTHREFLTSQPDELDSVAAVIAAVPEIEPAKGDPSINAALNHIGFVMEIAGSGSQVTLDANMLTSLMSHSDPSIAMSGQVGSQIKIRVGNTWLLASIRTQKLHQRDHGVIMAQVDFLGEGDEEKLTGKIYNFRRGVTRYPVPGSEVYAVSSADLKQVYAADSRAHVEIGTVFPTKDIRGALYVDAMLGKHFALLGSTGTGKSTSAALILHRICDIAPEGHIVMIDPHGEYSAAFKENGALFDVNNLAMPYWMMNFAEHCEIFVTSTGDDKQIDSDILARCLLQARSRNRIAETIGKLTVDAPIPYLLSDLTNIIQNEMGKLDKATSSAPFMRLKSKIDELKADPRYNFMFSGMLVGDTMADFVGKIFRLPSNGKPISIIDVSGVPSDITSTVVAVLSRLVFDYAIWSRNEQQRPILLVCEEAHRYIPSDRIAKDSAVRSILERIAKEGRKYGVSLGLITQRPSDLAEGVLSQCGTIISMRLNNDRDQAFVRAAMPEGARGFLDSIPALRNRECIICGEGVSIPIRVALDNLEEQKRPASEDPLFSQLWQETGGEAEILERVVRRWRAQGR
jgi:DNA helicase HerA-like ATPase